MPGVDPLAFIIISAAFGTLCAFILFILGSGVLRDIRGLARWGAACVVMAVAAMLFASRNMTPVFFSSFLPNLLVAIGVVGMHASLCEFGSAGRQRRWLRLLLIAAAVALAWVTFVHDSYRGRIVVMGGTLTVLFAACGLLIARFRQQGFAERFTESVFFATSAIMLARCLTAVFQDGGLTPSTDTSLMHSVYMGTFAFSLVALSVGFMLMVNRAMQLKLESLATRDQMTGMYRRDAFLALLDRSVERARREQRPMSVMIMDLDNFKHINDRHGHPVGDQVIIDFAAKALQILRRGDAIGRYGGEEFLVLLPDTTLDDAVAVAERLRVIAAEAASRDFPAYTVSIGVATLAIDCIDSAALIAAADNALYAAKKSGKNRVETIASRPAEVGGSRPAAMNSPVEHTMPI